MKTRACVHGRKILYINKTESTSPTVHLESILITLLIDAAEGRDIATADIARAYLFANMKDFVLIKTIGKYVDIMCEMSATYLEYVHQEGKHKVLYLELAKALYGCVKSALFWYETFVTRLKSMGFQLNPNDPCVTNMVITGKQCTICWYVDDLKISHESEDVVSDIIFKIEQRFGKMKVKRGNNIRLRAWI